MSKFEELKSICEKNGSAITVQMNKSGEAFIYVSHLADTEQVMKSLIHAAIEISKHRDQKNE